MGEKKVWTGGQQDCSSEKKKRSKQHQEREKLGTQSIYICLSAISQIISSRIYHFYPTLPGIKWLKPKWIYHSPSEIWQITKNPVTLISFSILKKWYYKFDPENIDIRMKNKGGKRNNQNLHKWPWVLVVVLAQFTKKQSAETMRTSLQLVHEITLNKIFQVQPRYTRDCDSKVGRRFTGIISAGTIELSLLFHNIQNP